MTAKPNITRREDWPEVLADFFAARSVQDLPSATFAWGTRDCALFVCDAVRAMTDVDLAADFRFKYSSERGALRVMQTFAGGGLAELADKMALEHGLAEVPKLMAQRGDIVLVESESGEPALGIVSMNGWDIFIVGKQGLVTRPLDCAVKAWRVSTVSSVEFQVSSEGQTQEQEAEPNVGDSGGTDRAPSAARRDVETQEQR